MIEISLLTKDTIDDVLTIAKERNLSHSLDEEELIDSLDCINHLVLIAKCDSSVCGYILCTLEGIEAEIDSIAVLKENEGQGIGKLLIEKALIKLKEINVERVLLEVRKDNKRAIGLYKKYGFIEYRIRKGYYNGIDGICMERTL